MERLHGTIATEVFARQPLSDLQEAQQRFDGFRRTYNLERPHEALADAVPASRYAPSPRPFPETVPPVTYDPQEVVRTVTVHGSISWQQRRHFVSRGLIGQPVPIRPTSQDGRWAVFFCHQHVATIDQRHPEAV